MYYKNNNNNIVNRVDNRCNKMYTSVNNNLLQIIISARINDLTTIEHQEIDTDTNKIIVSLPSVEWATPITPTIP